MRKDVRNFIERCPCCQKLNRVKIRNNINPFTLASTNVMERVAIDTIGPIEGEEKANKVSRNKYIVVIIDSFTRYTPLPQVYTLCPVFLYNDVFYFKNIRSQKHNLHIQIQN